VTRLVCLSAAGEVAASRTQAPPSTGLDDEQRITIIVSEFERAWNELRVNLIPA
jgi:hypothetical protein